MLRELSRGEAVRLTALGSVVRLFTLSGVSPISAAALGLPRFDGHIR